MMPLKDNVEHECFLVTKHSWKGKYRRLLSVGSAGLTTYTPDKFELTNRWPYADVVGIACTRGNAAAVNEFQLIVRKDRKADTIRLSSEYRSDIMTAVLRHHREFFERPKLTQRYDAKKFHWSGISFPTVLEVTPAALDQLDPTTGAVLASYNYKDINGIIGVQDYEGGIVIAYGTFSRLHVFKALNHHEIVQAISDAAVQYLGVSIKVLKSQITLATVERERFGAYSKDHALTSLSEFCVQKMSGRHPEPVRRTLCLTAQALLERDPQTYSVCTLRPLADVFALVRHGEGLQQFSVEYRTGAVRTYVTNERDSLLATLLDAVRSAGNRDVHVRVAATPRGKRVAPLTASVDEETEAALLRLITVPNLMVGAKRAEILERFNANVPHTGLNYSVTQDGLFAESKDRLILNALQALTHQITPDTTPSATGSLAAGSAQLNQHSDAELEATFHTLRRLLASKCGFAAFTNLPGFRETIGQRVVAALRRNNLAVTYAAIDMLNALMHSMHADYDLKQEQLNKLSLLASRAFLDGLLDMWTRHVQLGSGALVLSAMLDFLTFALCVPYSETTEGKQFDGLLEAVAGRGRSLYRLFQHSSLAIVKGAGLVMRAIIEEGEPAVAAQMQQLALDEAALCRHLLVALYTPSNEATAVLHRQLSRHLVGLWVQDGEDAMLLLQRIFPAGLLQFLDSDEEVPRTGDRESDRLNFRDNLAMAMSAAQRNQRSAAVVAVERHLEGIVHWGMNLLERQEKVQQAMKNRPIVLRNRRQKKRTTDKTVNLPLFFWQFARDHNTPNLIWNHKTREELRVALDSELRQFQADKELAGATLVAWNYEEFEVQYACLADEIKIGDYYIRLILEQDDWPENLVTDPVELFNALYRRVLCRNRINDDQLTVTSLQALAKVYRRYHERIGAFGDMAYILQLLDRSLSPSLRDALLNLVRCLVLNKSNCRPLVAHVQLLVDMLTLAHLHRGRAIPNTLTNVLESGPGQEASAEERDWFYNRDNAENKPDRCGPVTFSELKQLWAEQAINPRTRCWASGMDGWRTLQQIPQLKWCLMSRGPPIYNESELAAAILDVLIQCTGFFPSRARDGEAVLIPGPRLSRRIAEFTCLPHIVQVCLTHDPALLERCATLLGHIMADNPDISKIYMTGVFYFMLMYRGSNVLPIARFLKQTHMRQAFRNDDTTQEADTQSEIMQRSILAPMLPEAMICFLENHSAEKFAETFLGEFDKPEVIWNAEMRRLLTERIAAHLADFTPRLRGHTMARYPYCAIPAIAYPQLRNELFCDIFYLRHLCDERRFARWPIQDPVRLLRATLAAWAAEVAKKPAAMTVQQAFADLEIDVVQTPQPAEQQLRKQYYRLAQLYHPDKNPAGREQFQRVNKAYEFLCARELRSDGPSASNIVLILRTQSILFDRYAAELREYKYAGYPQLVQTIRMETGDAALFSKEVPLLQAAAELCYHTVHCSALNAEELRRQDGLEALLEAYGRCVSIMSADSKPEELHFEIIAHVTRCFEVACHFERCKERIVAMPQLVRDVCRVVYFKHGLSVALVTSLAVNNAELQAQLAQGGVLWSLLLFLFEYDYTLDESAVEAEAESNRQQQANDLAKLAILALVALAGYEMRLVLDPADPLSVCLKARGAAATATAIGSAGSVAAAAAATTTTVGGVDNTSAYASNATNLIQNSLHLAQSLNAITTVATAADSTAPAPNSSAFKTYVKPNEMFPAPTPPAAASATAAAPSEKQSPSGGKRYAIAPRPPQNRVVKQILDRLLTPYVADQLAGADDRAVLKLLTSNTRNPYVIWENGTRAQLCDFLEQQRVQAAREQYEDGVALWQAVEAFEFDAHRDELQIGGVYIRIYNEQPTFPIHNCSSFVIDLLDYLKQAYAFFNQSPTIAPPPQQQPQHPASLMMGMGILQPTRVHNYPTPASATSTSTTTQPPHKDLDSALTEYQRSRARASLEQNGNPSVSQAGKAPAYDFAANPRAIEHLLLTMRALSAAIKANPQVEIQCVGHFDWLFGFVAHGLRRPGSATEANVRAVKSLALDVVSLVSRNAECVAEIAAAEILGHFLVAIRDPLLAERQASVLHTLSGLLNAQRLVKEAQRRGAVTYLLDLFCGAVRTPQTREQCAELLAKMTADKLTGPKVRISCSKFLPGVFLDAMIESPGGAVTMFESVQEHPELIWNERTRDRCAAAVAAAAERFHALQCADAAAAVWRDADTVPELASAATDELVVSGVYLRLFVSNPGWTLRKPKQFLADLLDFVADCVSRPAGSSGASGEQPADALDTSTQALVALLRAQPTLADAVPTFGHIPKFFRQLTAAQPAAALRVLHQLAASEVCVAAMAQTDCVAALKGCMERHARLAAQVAETFSRLFRCQHDSLIRQSLECQLIPFLLKQLDSRLEYADNPSMVKAQIVAALKAMTSNLQYGDQVTHLLNSNPIWAEYRDQKHDLFITDSNVRGYLTGGNTTAGYLTQGPSKNIEVLTSPPPIDRDDPLARSPTD